MHKQDRLSATHEMYLKIIYQLQTAGDAARVGQMARGLGVHPSTVSAVVGTLDRMGYVTHDPYGVVRLTESGERIAECVMRRFETLRRFFTAVLGLAPDLAEVEACEMEHATSPLTIARLEALVADLAARAYVPPAGAPRQDDMCGPCIEAGTCTAAQIGSEDRPPPGRPTPTDNAR